MDNKEIAQVLRGALQQVKVNQANCTMDSMELCKYTYIIDHLDCAIDLLEPQEPWA